MKAKVNQTFTINSETELAHTKRFYFQKAQYPVPPPQKKPTTHNILLSRKFNKKYINK